MLAEAIQSVLRAAGVADGYELLKDFTRGQHIDAAAMRAFVATPAAARGRAQPACGPAAGSNMSDWPPTWRAASPTRTDDIICLLPQ